MSRLPGRAVGRIARAPMLRFARRNTTLIILSAVALAAALAVRLTQRQGAVDEALA